MRLLVPLLVLCGCSSGGPPLEPPPVIIDSDTATPRPTEGFAQAVRVTLDGAPTEGILVVQAGRAAQRALTDADGDAVVQVDVDVRGDLALMASHPEARQVLALLDRGPQERIELELVRFDRSDNEAYVFQDPGTTERSDTTAQCAHCHTRIVADWERSPHATASSSPITHDVYSGTASGLDASACASAGGAWVSGRLPGGGTGQRCRIGAGVLPDLNPDCGSPMTLCDSPTETGGCADCHAPGIDGALGGRDLLDARGFAHDHGAHCDVCHKVASVDLDAPAGVAGRLRIVRPSEPSERAGFDWTPLTFGPYPDVPNPRMGSVTSPVFSDAIFCGGCHQLDQPVLVPGATIDPDRWPAGVLPIHSTYEEWRQGPLAETAGCHACHMPPDPLAGNSADIEGARPAWGDVTNGWFRPPGSMRRHTWSGPRDSRVDMLRLAASLEVTATTHAQTLTVTTTVRHTGPGHAVPTGEPLRALALHVDVRCGGVPLPATSGPALDELGGALDTRDSTQDWTRWPSAQVGQRIRVGRQDGWRDDPGFGPFGDGTFTGPDAGLAAWTLVADARIDAVAPDGTVTTTPALPVGDVAWLAEAGTPVDRSGALALAGSPGLSFARVLADAQGRLHVPHHRAVDVTRDNRLMPATSVTVAHTFDASTCAAPEVVSRLLWRQFPLHLARERGWPLDERVMVEARP